MISKNIRYLFCSIILILFFVSCSQIEYARSGNNQALVSEQNGNVHKSEPLEKPTYKVVFRKSNLEALAIGRNRIEIQELMGEPEGKALMVEMGIYGIIVDLFWMKIRVRFMDGALFPLNF